MLLECSASDIIAGYASILEDLAKSRRYSVPTKNGRNALSSRCRTALTASIILS